MRDASALLETVELFQAPVERGTTEMTQHTRAETAVLHRPRLIERKVNAVTLLSQQEINALACGGWSVRDVEQHTTRDRRPFYTYFLVRQVGGTIENRATG